MTERSRMVMTCFDVIRNGSRTNRCRRVDRCDGCDDDDDARGTHHATSLPRRRKVTLSIAQLQQLAQERFVPPTVAFAEMYRHRAIVRNDVQRLTARTNRIRNVVAADLCQS